MRNRSTIRQAACLVASLALVALAFAPSSAQQKGKKTGDKKAPMKHVFTGPPPAHPYSVILARPTDRSMVVSVLANEEMETYVSFGNESGKHSRQTAPQKLEPRVPVEFLLESLQPDHRHFYRLHLKAAGKSEFAPQAERTFHTARKPGGTFVFTMQADSHLDQGTRIEVYERSLANALTAKTDFHIDLGDTFMTDKYPNHKGATPQYYAQRYYLSQLGHSAPIFMVLGNHDGERLDRYDATDDCMPVWSCRMRKSLFPNPRPDEFYSGNKTPMKPIGLVEDYYAWHWGDALFIALDPFWPTNKRGGKKSGDSNWTRTLGKEQYDWLKRTLESSDAKFKFVFIHHLVGGLDNQARGGSEAAELFEWGGKSKDGANEFKKHRPGWAAPIHELLVKHKVSAVFHGHDHFYARQELDGVVYQLVPQPGHPGFDRVRNAEEYGYVRGKFLPPSGILRVTVSAEKADVDYVRSYLAANETATRKNGEVTFSYSLRPGR